MLSLCLDQLLKSIKSKDSCEILVMNNGSTDGTKAVLHEYQKNSLFKIYNLKKNYGLNSYKKLLSKAKGKYVIMIDEDVISFPKDIDEIFETYFSIYKEYGFLALDVVKNEFTNGAKPADNFYLEDSRDGLTVQRGPTGAWCSCFKRSNFLKIKLFFNVLNISMKRSHDTTISFFFRNLLRLKHGIIKGRKCFHACGPYYANLYGHLDMQTEKYKNLGFGDLYEAYVTFKVIPPEAE